MKFLKMIFFAMVLAVGVSAQVDTNSSRFYMFVYFYNVQQEVGARLAFSSDGINWQKYNAEKELFQPKIADGETPLMRDPNIYFDSLTGVFHLTWTTGWLQKYIGYASSKDLITWSEQTKIPVGAKIDGCKLCWAPEFLYDEIKDSVMVYWSTDRGTIGKEAFCSMTKDFRYFTTPRVYFSPKTETGEGYTVIDETILKVAPGKYYMFFKDERTAGEAGKQSKNVHCVVGPTPQGPWWQGPWDQVSEPISKPGTEGPTAIIIGDEVRLIYDPYNSPTSTDRSSKAKLADFLGAEPPAKASWTVGEAMKTTDGNFLPGHGSMSVITRAKLMQVLYGKPDKTVYPKKYIHPKQEYIYVGEVSGYTPNPADTIPSDIAPVREYPLGKQNMGCGTGFGLALLIPLGLKGMSLRRRRKQNGDAK